ncbi:hypothetical protein D3C77_751190 [compost metagenome]
MRIVDRQDRSDVLVDNRHFDVARFVGDDTKTRHLGSGTRSGVDRNDRQLRLS